ncbi:MAG: glycosyltransferase [Blastocatellia bacterium]|nr:glycosyltransferase [Blastocatellia bacterium]
MMWLDQLALALSFLYGLDRWLKLLAIHRFFQRAQPVADTFSISLIQPVTRGAANLEGNLRARLKQTYAGRIQHLIICDESDRENRNLCERLAQDFPDREIAIIGTTSTFSEIATKTEKMLAGLERAEGEILVFIDDDIEPPPDALCRFMGALHQPEVGAVFGLARACSWETPWSSLMSAFVNANALLSYIPVTFVLDPYTITGHFFALKRADFVAAGGFAGMEKRVDDDRDIAVRLRALGLKCVQTAVVYRVSNRFAGWNDYAQQLKRWFVFPRQFIVPTLSTKEKLITTLLSFTIFLPAAAALLFLFYPNRWTLAALGMEYLWFVWAYAGCSRRYLDEPVPWLLLPATCFLTPFQLLHALFFSNTVIRWRGVPLNILPGGEAQVQKGFRADD